MLDFGEALKILKQGGTVWREGWNGKSRALRLHVPTKPSKLTLPYIYICTESGQRMPWTATQLDILGEDWETVQNPSGTP